MFSSMLSLLGSLRGGSSFITNSLRFRSSASAYLSRTFGVATNANIWTWSGWIKRGSLGGTYGILGYTVGSSDADNLAVRFVSDNFSMVGGTTSWRVTSRVFRDSAAWLHCVIAVDTTQTTPANRIKIYFNGVEETAFSTNNNPNQNTTIGVNRSGITDIGRYSTQYFDGYITDVNFIDGQALTPASFGAIDSSTGVWAPRPYSGTYGQNGFYLKFANTSSVAALGNDSSGNNNTWTVNNVSLTAGATYDSMIDVPVNYSDGGNGRGNYAVLNPLVQPNLTTTFSEANLAATIPTGSNSGTRVFGSMAFPTSGLWYLEASFSTDAAAGEWSYFGVSSTGVDPLNGSLGGAPSTEWCFVDTGFKRNNNITTAYGTSQGSAFTLRMAVNMNSGKIWVGDSVGWFNSGDPVAGTNEMYSGLPANLFPMAVYYRSLNTAQTVRFNFGQRPFAYTPPAGFRALNTNNLPTPLIVNGANFMAATTYTGNAAARSLSNAVNSVSFQPDLVWIKSRTPAATNHVLFDSVRGASIYAPLSSTTIGPEVTNANTLTAFGADGFSLGTDTTLVNANANSYVAWQWKESTLAGLDVVTYTGTGVARTISHNLGKAPAMVIVKSRTSTADWCVYHASISATNRLLLSQTNNSAADSTMWNNTAPTSSVFSVGTNVGVNASTINYVAYCFAEIAGFSRFGSYTGNGLADGPFVFCGFRPRFVMVKAAVGGTGNWTMLDTSRDVFNLMDNPLFADLPGTETPDAVNYNLDGLSNGFKLRTNGTGVNASGVTYIFAAFAENPSKYALAR